VTEQRRHSGFTLAELLVVIVIISMASVIALAVFSNTGDIKAGAAARTLTHDLQYAQNYAITNQTSVRVSFDANTNTYTLLEVPDDGEPVVLTHPVTKQPYVVTITSTRGMESVDISDADFSGSTLVVYDKLGSPDNGGAITLGSGNTVKTVSVAPVTGKVSIRDTGE
jgi:prepilin-type N-terminal cleavage/methylation domain-containing protein